MPITLRDTKGYALTHQEMDANWRHINQDNIREDLADPTSASNAVALIAFNGALAYNSGSDDWLGGLLYTVFGRTADEVAAGVTPTNYAYLPGHVERYGAVADGTGTGGGTNNYASIAAAISVVTTSAKAGVVYFRPGGIYRCDTGLEIDVSLHSMLGRRSMIDFTNIGTSDYALTLVAEVDLTGGSSMYAAANATEGIVFKGKQGAGETSPPSTVCNGILIAGTVSEIVSCYEFRNCVLRNFTNEISLAEDANAQAITWRDCNHVWCSTNVYFPIPTSGAAGSKMLFSGGFMTGSNTCFDLRNTAAQCIVEDMNVEGANDNLFYHLAGHLTVSNCHIEIGSSAQPYVYRAQSGQGFTGIRSYFEMTDTEIIVKGTRTNPVFDFSKAGSWRIAGGKLNTAGSTQTGPLIDSDSSGEAIGVLTIDGLALDKDSAQTIYGLSSAITVIDTWGEAKGIAAGDNTALNAGTQTVTANSLTTTGSPTYTLTWTRFADRCKCTLQILANGGTTASTANTTNFTGFPYDPAEISSGTVIAGNVSGGGVALVSTSGTGALYTPTWAADSLDRVISFEYRIAR